MDKVINKDKKFPLDCFFVLGLGRSGWATARFLATEHPEVYVWDDHPDQQKRAQEDGFSLGWPEGKNPHVVISPGIADHPLKRRAQQEGCPISCDIQLFFDFFPHVKAIGVTGSYAKSTTCALLYHALQRQGCASVLAGNIGVPIFSTLEKGFPPSALYILELSSYQLELCTHLPLWVAVLLNIAPHHLERHKTMENYLAIKEKIFHHAAIRIVGKNNPWLSKFHEASLVAQNESLSTEDSPIAPMMTFDKKDFTSPCTAFFASPHNQLIGSAASCILKAIGQQPLFEEFQGLPHRQEYVSTCRHISFWNDSKATSPHAAACALEALSEENTLLYWIVGGVKQKDDLSPLIPFLSQVHHAFVMGESAPRYTHFLQKHHVKCSIHENLTQAVHHAFQKAQMQSSAVRIVLSPACASFDQFKDFEARGEAFKQYTMHL